MSKTVLVTGASGFIGKHIVRELLEQGYKVRGSVRSDKRRQQVRDLFPDADIDFVDLDLTSDAGWAEAMEGVDVLMHVASPFPGDEPKDRNELIRPAVDGTMRALRAAQSAGVHRVVLTSSCAAIYKDTSKAADAASTRDNWTDVDAKFTGAYEASKTLAERAAWDFVAKHPEMQLTTINPGGVFGPPMDEHYGTSLGIVEQMMTGKMPAVPNINLPAVDVRDVATMHVAAIDNDATVGQRFPANAGAVYFADAAKSLKAAFPDSKVSTRILPNFVVKIVGRFNGEVKQIARQLGWNADVVGTDGPEVMGFTYIPTTDAIIASAQYINDHTLATNKK